MTENSTNLIMYTTQDGVTKIQATFDNDTVWLSLDQMAQLFQRDKSTISRHIKNIFDEGELEKNRVVANFATTAADGKNYQVDYYNLDVIISVGYRVKSLRGTQFRIWAMNILKEYMQKGFALDDERLKELGGGNYFDELLARIRDIRSSEKVFWRKVLEIYSTSIDYDPHAESSVRFFKEVQNKMHWAAHKHTAAEIIYNRADAQKQNMGLTSWSGRRIKKTDVEIAKNYLSDTELDALNKIVAAYLDIAEVRALNHEPMYMKDWLETIDDYLKMTRREILTTAGRISHEKAIEKAHSEYEKYKTTQPEALSAVETHFLNSISELEHREEKTVKRRNGGAEEK
ncbi:virulence RhuM family protein [uncultured Fibrobacter sp.]|uniref:virulence RhuM family protein n=1 Tax=uncultured Fibrobacter sp. TaxID=261512 RepID=UPI002803C4ED|nr:virulence RhuM family protein [uncultured Fibrobacter sp.]